MKLSQDQIEQYRSSGYLVIEDALSEDDLAPVVAGINRFVDARARQLQEEGIIRELHEDEPFERRYLRLFEQSEAIAQGLDIMESKIPELFRFLHNDNLLDVVESLLGSELSCNPIQHLRAKVPNRSLRDGNPDYYLNVPWHQDAGVTLEEAEQSDIITFWIPLVDANETTGCMQVMPGVHLGGYRTHQAEGGFTIVPEQLPDVKGVPVPCPRGGIVIMNKLTPHRGTPNTSDMVRWTLDLRYQKSGEPTGRPHYPSFTVRSRINPGLAESDYEEWGRRWDEALAAGRGKQIHRVLKQ